MSVPNDPGFYLQGYHEAQQDRKGQTHQLHPMTGPKISVLLTQMLTEVEGRASGGNELGPCQGLQVHWKR